MIQIIKRFSLNLYFDCFDDIPSFIFLDIYLLKLTIALEKGRGDKKNFSLNI